VIFVHRGRETRGVILLTVSELADIPHAHLGTPAAPHPFRPEPESGDGRDGKTVMLPVKTHDSFGVPAAVVERPLQPDAPQLLTVSMGAEWFQLSGRPRVALETRLPLRRLLLALAEMKQRTPNAVLPVTAAFEAGWPGERANPTAAAMRVYTAVHSLRRLGLRGLLIRRRRGYVLDLEVQIAMESQYPPALVDGTVNQHAESAELEAAEAIEPMANSA
jgi:hypothetical protein